MRKVCKQIGCYAKVWRNSYYGNSDYCWEHDPDVKEALRVFMGVE